LQSTTLAPLLNLIPRARIAAERICLAYRHDACDVDSMRNKRRARGIETPPRRADASRLSDRNEPELIRSTVALRSSALRWVRRKCEFGSRRSFAIATQEELRVESTNPSDDAAVGSFFP
jgi:hypothetical protein